MSIKSKNESNNNADIMGICEFMKKHKLGYDLLVSPLMSTMTITKGVDGQYDYAFSVKFIFGEHGESVGAAMVYGMCSLDKDEIMRAGEAVAKDLEGKTITVEDMFEAMEVAELAAMANLQPDNEFESPISDEPVIAIPVSTPVTKQQRIRYFNNFGIPEHAYSIICRIEQQLGIFADGDWVLLDTISSTPKEEFSVNSIVHNYRQRVAVGI